MLSDGMFVHSMQIIEVGGEVPLMTKPSRLSFDAKQTSFFKTKVEEFFCTIRYTMFFFFFLK